MRLGSGGAVLRSIWPAPLALLALLALPGRADAEGFWSRAAERDHGASRRVALSATRMLAGRGDDADAHRVRLALIEDPRAPALSDRALVSLSLVALELGVSPGVERLARLERIAWSSEIAPWSGVAARVLGTLEWRRGNAALACRHFERALALSSAPEERAELLVRLGFAERSLGQHAGSERHFTRALRLADDASVARRDLEAALVGLALLAVDAGDAAAAKRFAVRSQAVQSARSNVSGVTLDAAFELGPVVAAAIERVRALGREDSALSEGEPPEGQAPEDQPARGRSPNPAD